MGWDSAELFRDLLEKASESLSKGVFDKLVDLAVREASYAYKDVCMLLERQMKRSKATGKDRLNVLYVLSAICRRSRKQNGRKDKYGPRIAGRLEIIAGYLSELPTPYWSDVAKTVATWSDENIVGPESLAHFSGFRVEGRKNRAEPAGAAPEPANGTSSSAVRSAGGGPSGTLPDWARGAQALEAEPPPANRTPSEPLVAPESPVPPAFEQESALREPPGQAGVFLPPPPSIGGAPPSGVAGIGAAPLASVERPRKRKSRWAEPDAAEPPQAQPPPVQEAVLQPWQQPTAAGNGGLEPVTSTHVSASVYPPWQSHAAQHPLAAQDLQQHGAISQGGPPPPSAPGAWLPSPAPSASFAFDHGSHAAANPPQQHQMPAFQFPQPAYGQANFADPSAQGQPVFHGGSGGGGGLHAAVHQPEFAPPSGQAWPPQLYQRPPPRPPPGAPPPSAAVLIPPGAPPPPPPIGDPRASPAAMR